MYTYIVSLLFLGTHTRTHVHSHARYTYKFDKLSA